MDYWKGDVLLSPWDRVNKALCKDSLQSRVVKLLLCAYYYYCYFIYLNSLVLLLLHHIFKLPIIITITIMSYV